MDGLVFENQEQEVATLITVISGEYLIVKIYVGSSLAIQFPLANTADANEVELRATNVINQTGIVNNSVRVEITP